MKIAVILGTRPEIIKMSPIIRALTTDKNSEHFLIHTGQHYSYEMDKVFFEELKLPLPKYSLNTGSGTHGVQTARMIEGIETILLKEMPTAILVQGDTNTVLAGALAASKLRIKIGHVEAGLRSYDRTMPEEINRVIVDHISDYLFCPTKESEKILITEGIPKEKIFVTGNTVVDAVLQSLPLLPRSERTNEYFLVTAHRPANVDSKESLDNLFKGLKLIYDEYGIQLLYPIHPRTKKMIEQHHIEIPTGIKLIPPAGFLEFLQLESNAKLILTDSGGVQEEACILHVPCVTLRENTERPETVAVHANMLAGINPQKMLFATKQMLSIDRSWNNPFGDGHAGNRIINIIKRGKNEI